MFNFSVDYDLHSDPRYRAGRVSPWPRLAGGSSYINIKPTELQIVLDEHDKEIPMADDERPPKSFFDFESDAESTHEKVTFNERVETMKHTIERLMQRVISANPDNSISKTRSSSMDQSKTIRPPTPATSPPCPTR